MAKATFAAGCFWGIEAAFRKVDGVTDTWVGYAGGSTQNPTYEQVCSGQTGHAEVVEVDFAAEKVSYDELLDVFWNIHAPTQLNRQGPDVGTQYRTAVFYHDEDQKLVAEVSKEKREASGCHSNPIVTEVIEASDFWIAEDYHQRYFEKMGRMRRVFAP